ASSMVATVRQKADMTEGAASRP
ncbi:MAG: hypothetical protein QG602_4208, partial [Verrucomicrobiota bacterium]|nr:hypothetical protein [Verrucomicrobiota bacterium]